MIQGRGPAARSPIGIIYNTSMSRPDAALALAALYSAASRISLRVASICVTGSGLGSAVFCDVVMRTYVPRVGGSNTVLPIGLAADGPLPPDTPMVKAAIDRRNAAGEPQYARSVHRVSDTALAEAVLRNAATLTTQAAIVLSGPATSLARALNLADAAPIFKERIKRLVIVDAGEPRTDAAAISDLIQKWPTPIAYCGRDVGEALRFPGARLDELFQWSPEHPVVDAYKAFKTMPYDAPLYDVAAVHYAADADSAAWDASETGTLAVGSAGRLTFAPGAGPIARLTPVAATRETLLASLITMATDKPAPPPLRGRRGG